MLRICDLHAMPRPHTHPSHGTWDLNDQVRGRVLDLETPLVKVLKCSNLELT